MVANCHLIGNIQTIRVYWFVGSRTRKEGVCEGLDSCLTLSTLFMGAKLGFQKLRHCLSKYFFVDNSLTTKIMSIKLPQNRALRNWKYALWLPKIVRKVPLARGDIRWSIIHTYAQFMDILIGDVYQVLLSRPSYIILYSWIAHQLDIWTSLERRHN